MIKENKKLKDFKLPSTNDSGFQLKKEIKNFETACSRSYG